jgi:hypothetical protein
MGEDRKAVRYGSHLGLARAVEAELKLPSS